MAPGLSHLLNCCWKISGGNVRTGLRAVQTNHVPAQGSSRPEQDGCWLMQGKPGCSSTPRNAPLPMLTASPAPHQPEGEDTCLAAPASTCKHWLPETHQLAKQGGFVPTPRAPHPGLSPHHELCKRHPANFCELLVTTGRGRWASSLASPLPSS